MPPTRHNIDKNKNPIEIKINTGIINFPVPQTDVYITICLSKKITQRDKSKQKKVNKRK